MFLIVTRNFPPDVGGMQVLMGGLSENLLNHGPVKVFTYEYENSNFYDSKSTANIKRIKGTLKVETVLFSEASNVDLANARVLIIDRILSLVSVTPTLTVSVLANTLNL